MTMDHLQHPDDERLAAYAAGDGHLDLATHVAGCDRCAPLVADLRALRAALAALPDLAPSRRLRFIPPAAAEPATAGGGFPGLVRRLFAPAMVAGAALVLVGSVGMAATPLAPASPELRGGMEQAPAVGGADASTPGAAAAPSTTELSEALSATASAATDRSMSDDGPSAPGVATTENGDEPAEHVALGSQGGSAPWLGMTIAGGLLLIAALVLRWTVVPRAPDPPAYPGA